MNFRNTGNTVFHYISEAFGKSLEPDPLTAILGLTSSLSFANDFEKKKKTFVSNGAFVLTVKTALYCIKNCGYCY